MKRIVLFGTSANPPTGEGGHIGLVRWAKRQSFAGGTVDGVWVLPVFRHAFDDKRQMPAFSHRYRMAELAFADVDGVKVLPWEKTLADLYPSERLGTIDLIRWLEPQYPGTRFALLLGADTFRDLAAGRWKQSEALLAKVDVLAVARAGRAPVDGLEPVPELREISSSAVRASQEADFVRDAVHPGVFDYIREHGLYALGSLSAGE